MDHCLLNDVLTTKRHWTISASISLELPLACYHTDKSPLITLNVSLFIPLSSSLWFKLLICLYIHHLHTCHQLLQFQPLSIPLSYFPNPLHISSLATDTTQIYTLCTLLSTYFHALYRLPNFYNPCPSEWIAFASFMRELQWCRCVCICKHLCDNMTCYGRNELSSKIC